ncbi:hypothetical protein T439DRAFT_47469 [Meredithblackwellia eburnea MCA 4105]
MPDWVEPNPEVVSLKKRNLELQAQLETSKNTVLQLQQKLDESQRTLREDIYKRQEQEARAVKAEEALRKKTEDYKASLLQKSNSDKALVECEAKLAAALKENKKLAYDVELASSRQSSIPVPNARKAAEEKLALENQNRSLTDEVKSLKQQLSEKGALDKSTTNGRPSISPADLSQSASQSRNRFGYGSTNKPDAPSSIARPSSSLGRPSSSLGNHSQLPVPNRRRSSSVAFGIPVPSSSNNSSNARITQLERDLDESRQRTDTVEKDLANVQAKLASKEKTLMQVENKLMALEKDKASALEKMENSLEDAQYEAERLKSDMAQLKVDLRKEGDQALKVLRDDKTALSTKISRLESDLEKRVEQLERAESRKEELEEALASKAEELRTLRKTLEMEVEDLKTSKAELEEELAIAEQSMASAGEGRDAAKAQLERVQKELAGLQATSATTSEQLQLEKSELEVQLTQAQSDLATASHQLADELAKRAASSEDDNKERELLLLEMSTLKATIQTTQLKVEELEAQNAIAISHDDFDAATAELDLRIEHLQNQLSDRDQEILIQENALEESQAIIRDLESRLAAAQDGAQASSELNAHLSEYESDLKTAQNLVIRLREERDDLRARLDFARNDARFQYDASAEKLRDLEDTKSHDLAELQVKLLEQTSMWEQEVAAHKEVLSTLAQVEAARESVSADLEEARNSIAVLMVKDAEYRSLVEETERLTEKVDNVKAELAETKQTLDSERDVLSSTKSMLEEANAANEELHSTITELEEEVDAVSDDAATSRHQLEEEIQELKAKLNRRTEQIGEQTQTIAILTSKLELPSALNEHAGDETVEEDAEPEGLSIVDNSSSHWASKVAQLESALSESHLIREELNQQLSEKSQELEATARKLTAAQEDRSALQESSTSHLNELEGKLAASQLNVESETVRRSALESEISGLTEQIGRLESELANIQAEAEKSKAVAEGQQAELDITKSNLANVVAAEEDRLSTIARLEATIQNLQGELSETNNRLAEREQEVESLQADVEATTRSVGEETAQLENNIAELRGQLRTLQLENERLQECVDGHQMELSRLEQLVINGDAVRSEVGRLEEELRVMTGQHGEASRALSEARKSLEDQERSMASLHAQFEQANAERAELQRASEEQTTTTIQLEQNLRDADQVVEELEQRNIELTEQLSFVNDRLEDSVQQLAKAEASMAAEGELQLELDQARSTIAELESALEAQTAGASQAKVAAAEAASREIRTLKNLARASANESEVVKTQIEQLQQERDVQIALLQKEKEELQKTSEGRLDEVLNALEAAEVRMREYEEQIAMMDSQLQQKASEMEETDDKYLDVLRKQKLQLNQIDRLKEKIGRLQLDLASSKDAALSSQPQPQTLAHSAAPSSGKKRNRPEEFEPLTTVTTTPRAIIAAAPRGVSAPSHTPSSRTEKENIVTTSANKARLASGKKEGVIQVMPDGLVPLKPEHRVVESQRREPLSVKRGGVVETHSQPGSNLVNLKARMQGMQQRSLQPSA